MLYSLLRVVLDPPVCNERQQQIPRVAITVWYTILQRPGQALDARCKVAVRAHICQLRHIRANIGFSECLPSGLVGRAIECLLVTRTVQLIMEVREHLAVARFGGGGHHVRPERRTALHKRVHACAIIVFGGDGAAHLAKRHAMRQRPLKGGKAVGGHILRIVPGGEPRARIAMAQSRLRRRRIPRHVETPEPLENGQGTGCRRTRLRVEHKRLCPIE